MITWLYAIICSQALFQTERGGRGYTWYHVYPPTYTHTNMYTHTHMYMSPTYICSVHMFTCTRIHIYIRVHMFTGRMSTCTFDHCTPAPMTGVYPFILSHKHLHTDCVFTGHTNTCASDHCTPVSMSSVHPFCMHTYVSQYTYSYVHVSTCTCVGMYTCSYTRMLTCT